jgi:hypothetical protein
MEVGVKLLAFLGLLVLMVPIALWQAFCLTLMWDWYAPPALGDLSMKTAVGAMMIISLVTLKAPRESDPDTLDRVLMSIIGPAIGLLAARLMLWFV